MLPVPLLPPRPPGPGQLDPGNGNPPIIAGIAPGKFNFQTKLDKKEKICLPSDAVCSSDSSCAGYPLAFCDGVCKCREGALNAGSACIVAVENGGQLGGSCSNGQAYVAEIGTCLAGPPLLWHNFDLLFLLLQSPAPALPANTPNSAPAKSLALSADA